MDFEPKTTIWFLRTGIDASNKVVCKDKDELVACLTRDGNVQGRCTEYSFQREQAAFAIRVDHSDVPYYGLMQSDTVLYINEETTGAFYIVGNIISVEWKNPDCSFVRFAIDAFMTYQLMIDWDKTYAYVEREHVKEDWASEGGHPLFTNIGPMEDFSVVPDTPFYHFEKTFNPNMVLIHSPYDMSGKPNFDGDVVGNLYTSLNSPVTGSNGANQFFKTIADEKEASINNIVSVFGIPQDFADAVQRGGSTTYTESLPPVEEANLTSFEIKYNNAKCWAAPFCIVKLYSSDGSSLDFNPQWFGNDADNYKLNIKVGGAGKQFAGAMATFDNRAGAFNWKNWNDWCVILAELPSCPWTADGFREWRTTNNVSVRAKQVNTFVNGVAGMAQGAATALFSEGKSRIGSVVNGIAQIATTASGTAERMASIQATINAAKASGATVDGTGSFSGLFDVAQEGWGFKVVYLTVQNYIMRSIDQFFDRFGYRVNQLKKIGLRNRPYWTFIKTAECHVAASTGIPFIFEQAINEMFNAGVTMWDTDKYKSGHKIGDFSKASDNKGIMGG